MKCEPARATGARMSNISLSQLIFECDQCGACCRKLILEADHLDAIREPRIQAEGRLLDGKGKIDFDEAEWGLNNPDGMACVFLNEDNSCGIYNTRPSECVSFQAGSEQCQMAREFAKLEAIEPVSRMANGSYADKLHILCRDGEN